MEKSLEDPSIFIKPKDSSGNYHRNHYYRGFAGGTPKEIPGKPHVEILLMKTLELSSEESIENLFVEIPGEIFGWTHEELFKRMYTFFECNSWRNF